MAEQSSIQKQLNALSDQVNACFGGDRLPIIKQLKRARQKLRQKKFKPEQLESIAQQIQQSQQKVADRKHRKHALNYDESLPVAGKRDEIIAAIQANQVVIVCGETGSGKTTQLPKLCLQAGRGTTGYIGHTQPRRIAARSVSARIAEELETQLGDTVGFKIRFQDQSSENSSIKVMTDGILLAETVNDHWLQQYDTLIIDEAHERSLNIDFLLGLLKHILPKRPDLKLIITSATIDPERFAKHFDDAPIIMVSGRTYPVEVRYNPLITHEDEEDLDLIDGVCHAVEELGHDGTGDILVFLSGEREIREVAKALEKRKYPSTEVLPLYARLSQQEQQQIFSPHGKRRIVLATNVAETSLTVPGIRYVIDSGHARISRYSYRTKVQRLPIESISQASANQRKGRCGRVAPGICIRLYSEEDFEARPEFTEPEILRTNLASVILQMLNLRLGQLEHFPFIDAPDRRYVNDGYKLLQELGAVDEKRHLTPLGKQMATLPIEPRIARMILAGAENNSLNEVLIIAAALSVQDPRERPHDKQQAADGCHGAYRDKQSDFIAYINLWNTFFEKKKALTNSKLRAWCKDHFIAYLRMREWIDIHQQLRQMVQELALKTSNSHADYDAIHQALLTGLLGQLALKGEGYEYQGARNTKLWIFPGSGVSKSAPKWIMAAQWLETSKMYAHTIAKIEPEWVERLAGHLVKRSYSEPHWQQKPAKVGAFERVTLYGLPIVAKRRVNYGPVDAKISREIFIRHALVYGEWDSRERFFKQNLATIHQLESLEAKARRRDLLVDEQAIYDFFDQRVPETVFDGVSFQKWWKQVKGENADLLTLTEADLTAQSTDVVSEFAYPDQIEANGVRFGLEYAFEPGKQQDGISVQVPLAALNLLDADRFDWLVPGLIEEKIIALIKTLPKGLRKHLVPAPDYAKQAVEKLPYGKGHLLTQLTQVLSELGGVDIPLDAWQPDQLPEHLRTKFELLDEQGNVAKSTWDIQQLKNDFSDDAQRAFQKAPSDQPQQDYLQHWFADGLPESVAFEKQGVSLRGYPALDYRGHQLETALLDSAEAANQRHLHALVKLASERYNETLRHLRRNLPGQQALCLHYASLGQSQDLIEQIMQASVTALCFSDRLPQSQNELDALLEKQRADLVPWVESFATLIGEVLALYYHIRLMLKNNVSLAMAMSFSDAQAQLERMLYSRFIVETRYDHLKSLPRYLNALKYRLQKLDADPNRDRLRMREIQPLQAKLDDLSEEQMAVPQVQEFRWALEELRVSLFAQNFGTPMPVSAKRLNRQWEEQVKPALLVAG